MSSSCKIALKRMPQTPLVMSERWFGGNGLLRSGRKPLPEPMLIRIYVAICRH